MTETFNGSHIVFRKLIVDHSRRPRKPTRLDETSSVWKLVFQSFASWLAIVASICHRTTSKKQNLLHNLGLYISPPMEVHGRTGAGFRNADESTCFLSWNSFCKHGSVNVFKTAAIQSLLLPVERFVRLRNGDCWNVARNST